MIFLCGKEEHNLVKRIQQSDFTLKLGRTEFGSGYFKSHSRESSLGNSYIGTSTEFDQEVELFVSSAQPELEVHTSKCCCCCSSD